MVDYIDQNPVTAGVERRRALIEDRRQKQQAADLDAAMRRGIAKITAPQQPQEEPVDPRQLPGAQAQPKPQPGPKSDTGTVTAEQTTVTETRPAGDVAAQTAGVFVTPSDQAPYAPVEGAGRQDPILKHVVAVPGGGQAAMQRYDQLQGQKDDAERRAIEALARDDLTTFNHYAQIAGLRVPQQVLNDANARRLFGAGMMIADQFYGDASPQQALAFTQEYVRSGGDQNRAFAAAGQPPQRGGTGKEPAQQRMIQFLESRGIPFEQATQMVMSAKANDPRAAEQIWKVVYDNAPGTHEERQMVADEATKNFLGQFGAGNWQSVTGAEGAGAPAAPQPTATHRYDPDMMRIQPIQ